MFNWIKESLFGSNNKLEQEEEGYTVFLEQNHFSPSIPPMPEVKPCKPDLNISEPIISFVECVRNNPKRFEVYSDMTNSPLSSTLNKAYKIWDKSICKGWYIKEHFYMGSLHIGLYYSDDYRHYADAFFLSSDEKEYLIKEISAIMNYRIGRKVKLDDIRQQRRVRDSRNQLMEIYK